MTPTSNKQVKVLPDKSTQTQQDTR